MRKLFSMFGFYFLMLGANAQHHCATDQKMMDALAAEQSYDQSFSDFQEVQRQFALDVFQDAIRDDQKEFVVPVVVHVVYTDETNNISSEQIHTQIAALNRDFNLLNADQSEIPEVFKSFRSNVSFKFVLADRDPDGNFTNGITRTQTTVEGIGDTEKYFKTSQGGINPWPQPHYMNIWVCDIPGQVLGYAFLPASNMSERDGIVMAPRAFGTMGTAQAPYNMGRTLVHEVGHYFGLVHLWGSESGDCGKTDYMSDTPNQFGPNNGCQTFPQMSCPEEPDGDMFMNYMDYASDGCMFLFTERQAAFMRLVMTTSRITLQHSQAVTSVSEPIADRGATIYPNPATGQMYLEYLSKQLPAAVSLWSIDGELIKTWTPIKPIEIIDVSDITQGVYVVKMSNQTLRVVVQ
jgi:hypothetical protein